MKTINVKHPYYCSEGNYYKAGEHERIGSWAEFVKEYGDLDEDLNYIWRWDYSEDRSSVMFFFMLQRKARCRSVEVAVSPDDETAIVEFLRVKWNHVKRLWEPIGEQEALARAGYTGPDALERALARLAHLEEVERIADQMGPKESK